MNFSRKLPAICRTVMAGFVAAGLLSGCASKPKDQSPEAVAYRQQANDLWEGTNRAIFNFNLKLDKAILRPVAGFYGDYMPPPVRLAIRNFIDNIFTPVTFVNDVLQGEARRAGTSLSRLIINTTFGLGGVMDVASHSGIERHSEDFGQTLAVWGFDDGPYFVTPILGSSNVRDMFGFIADLALDPMTWVYMDQHISYVSPIIRTVDFVDLRAANMQEIDDLERNSIDFYATARSAYRQLRKERIANGRTPEADDGGEIEDDPFDEDFDDFEDFEDFEEEDLPGDAVVNPG